jgi:hypothetical protein
MDVTACLNIFLTAEQKVDFFSLQQHAKT